MSERERKKGKLVCYYTPQLTSSPSSSCFGSPPIFSLVMLLLLLLRWLMVGGGGSFNSKARGIGRGGGNKRHSENTKERKKVQSGSSRRNIAFLFCHYIHWNVCVHTAVAHTHEEKTQNIYIKIAMMETKKKGETPTTKKFFGLPLKFYIFIWNNKGRCDGRQGGRRRSWQIYHHRSLSHRKTQSKKIYNAHKHFYFLSPF